MVLKPRRHQNLPFQAVGCKYSPLRENEIRVLRLPPSSLQVIKPLLCSLETVDLSDCQYEALSYCWGDSETQTLATIKIDGDDFLVSAHLETALTTLVAHGSQTVWVDAVCINQNDKDEKAMQVLRMRDIYSKAQRTAVWIGEAMEHTEEAFANVSKLYLAESDDSKVSIWSQRGPWVECLNGIIKRPYWSRSWTIQEVVVSPNVTLFCGSFSLPFFELADVLLHEDTSKHVNVTYSTFSYLRTVRQMRSPDYQDPELGLFALTWHFRSRKLTEKRDRAYAFRGLLKSEKSLIGDSAVVDYNRNPLYLWCILSKEIMLRHQSVVPLALAEKNATGLLEDSTWYVDFTTNNDKAKIVEKGPALFWSGGLDDPLYHPLQVSDFRAAGNSRAHVTADPKMSSIISVQGLICDEIVAVGVAVRQCQIFSRQPDYFKLFTGWEAVVGGPWDRSRTATNNGALDAPQIFDLTITGGAWTQQPLTWRHWNHRNEAESLYHPAVWHFLTGGHPIDPVHGQRKEAGYDEESRHMFAAQALHTQYERIRDDACEGRRIALFKSGRFGLVSEYADTGDILVVLLGCGVPMILHPTGNVTGSKSSFGVGKQDENRKKTFRLRGQSYVHDLMYYSGDIQSDIAQGKVTLETFPIEGCTSGNSDAFEESPGTDQAPSVGVGISTKTPSYVFNKATQSKET